MGCCCCYSAVVDPYTVAAMYVYNVRTHNELNTGCIYVYMHVALQHSLALNVIFFLWRLRVFVCVCVVLESLHILYITHSSKPPKHTELSAQCERIAI